MKPYKPKTVGEMIACLSRFNPDLPIKVNHEVRYSSWTTGDEESDITIYDFETRIVIDD